LYSYSYRSYEYQYEYEDAVIPHTSFKSARFGPSSDMTIQAGLTGPPHTPQLRVRVWSDRPGSGVDLRMAKTGAPITGATVLARAIPATLAGEASLPRSVFEIAGLPPDTPVRIEIGGEACGVLTPPLPEGELRILVGSCFYQPDDKGALAAACALLRDQDRPHIRLHGGDQIYLDSGALPGGDTALARTLARYRTYWNDAAHSGYLRGGITLFTPDDHDFWNDYPYSMPHLDRSWSGAWQEHAHAAQLAFEAYQSLGNPEARSWFSLDLGLVSLFVLDTRTRRGTDSRNPPPRLFNADQRDALLQWSATLTKPGVLLSAMPLFQKAAGKVLGLFTSDHNLLSWPEDARQIWRAVEQAPFGVLVLTGDIHRGVFSEWRTGEPGKVRQNYELVSSPLRLLGYPWTPSRKAGAQPSGLQLGAELGRRDVARTYYGTSTDHFSLLRFTPSPLGVRATATVHRVPDALTPPSELEFGDPCRAGFYLCREV
jgi:hypothetical protein